MIGDAWLIGGAAALVGVIGLIGAWAAYAHHAYARVAPVARPCRDCPQPALVDGYALDYRERGTRRDVAPLVLLHGGPGHSSRSFGSAFDAFADERRVITYDQRGSGHSQVRERIADYHIDRLVDELEALRRSVIGAERIIVVGHSFGAALALRYALAQPQHVERIVLIGGIRINNGMRHRWFWRWFGPALYASALGIPPAAAADADAWLGALSLRSDRERLFDRRQDALIADSGPISFVTWRECSRSLAGPDARDMLRRLAIPTLVIYGVADSPFSGAPVAAELCATLPQARSVAFTASGHWPFLEEPVRFAQVLRDFLREDGER